MNPNSKQIKDLLKVTPKVIVTSPAQEVDIDPNMEGIDHIRVDLGANEYLGRALAPEHPSVFFHPAFGSFLSIHSMTVYLATECQDEKVRHLTAEALRQHIRDTGIVTKQIRDIECVDAVSVLRSAVFYRLLSKPELLEKFVQSELPLYAYALRRDEVVRKHHWLETHLTFLRKKLKQSSNIDIVSLLNEINNEKSAMLKN